MPYLLPTEKLVQKTTPAGLALELSLWGVSGVLTQALSNGIRQKAIFGKPVLHGVAGLVGIGVGYLAHLLEKDGLERLEKERDLLVMKRIERQASE